MSKQGRGKRQEAMETAGNREEAEGKREEAAGADQPINRSTDQPVAPSADQPVRLEDLSLDQIADLPFATAISLCQSHQLPVDVPPAAVRRMLKAFRLGGLTKFLPGGLTLCPNDHYLSSAEQTIGQDPPMHWMRCSGPRRCRFKR